HRLADRNEAHLPLPETCDLTKDIQNGPHTPFLQASPPPSTSPPTSIAERPGFRVFDVPDD
ncbi:hypothetical protein LZ32DRAFT_569518, partial [Colletotrichum eremochloae]